MCVVDLDVCTMRCTIEARPQGLLFLLGVPDGALTIGCMYSSSTVALRGIILYCTSRRTVFDFYCIPCLAINNLGAPRYWGAVSVRWHRTAKIAHPPMYL